MSRRILLLSLTFCLSFPVNSVLSSGFNIKLRKTDVSDLKQQLLPAFDRNIQYLNKILQCLEQGSSTDDCLYKFPPPGSESGTKNSSNEGFKHAIHKKLDKRLDKRELTEIDIIEGLKELLQQAEKVRSCLVAGQTANELKDCIVNYKKS